MLNKMIEEFVSNGIQTMRIYRHFKGGYYVVQAIATVESTGEEVVIYQSLQDGRVWTRPVSVFRELVPEDKENPTGQKYRFEQVTKFNNQLNLISTEELVKELLQRNDCPLELQTTSDKVWREDYIVGRYVYVYVDSNVTVEDFDVCNAFESLDRALAFVRNNPSYKLMKRVYLKQDFD